MTDLTRVIACKTPQEAASEAGLLIGANYNVVVINGTDAVELVESEDSKLTWESGSGFDWILVIGSRKPIVPVE